MTNKTMIQQAARAWADQACWTEQYIERLPVVLPEVTEALKEAVAKAKKFRELAEQAGNAHGDE